MIVLLGGRAAEFVVFDALSTGAADDLAKATDIARSMVVRYGMNKELGPVSFEPNPPAFLQMPLPLAQQQKFSEETTRKIDQEVQKILLSAYDEAVRIIKSQRSRLEQGAQLLLQKETLNEEDLKALIRSV